MWNRRTTSLLAVAAVGLTMSLSGCGSGSSQPDAGTTPPASTLSPGAVPAPSSAPSKELVTWAGSMCRVVSAHTRQVTPATIDRSNPKATIDGMSRMFGTMAGLLAAQDHDLGQLDAPHPAADRKAFEQSLARLGRAASVMHHAQATLQRGSSAASPDIMRTLRAAGTLSVDGQPYPGFVVDLAGREPRLEAAIAAAPACRAFAVA